jgi:phenylacetate-CoA ligase
MGSTPQRRRELEGLERSELESYQLARLQELFAATLPANALYREKFCGLSVPPRSLAEFRQLPFTYKEDLLSAPRADQLCPHQTFPTSAYVRLHQTSGTRGRPLMVLNTARDWEQWIDCWQYVLDAAGIEANDHVFMAFSFGPFIGFWSAHDACVRRGCMVIPGGGLSTVGRLELMRTSRATVLMCTPSYALHLAEVGAAHQIDTAALGIRRVVLAGEPGGSIPSTRSKIENAWQALVIDHAGASEVGAWGYGDREGRGLYVNEAEFLAEFLSVERGAPAREGELSELILTNLSRYGTPAIRYRTGDLVRPTWRHAGPVRFVFLDGGILSRVDDMLIIRGVNVFPSAIEQIVRGFPEVVEFRVTISKQGALDSLAIEVEDRLKQPQRIAEEVRARLGLRVQVESVPLGSLPRFDAKARRFVDLRYQEAG